MEHWERLSIGSIPISNTPQSLWDNAVEYFKWCDNNPKIDEFTVRTGKEAGRVYKENKTRPYTIKGLCLHCGVNEEYLKDLRNSKDRTSEYCIVIEKILYIIWVQLAENAITGIFNPIFSAKILNLEVDDTPVGAVQVNVVHGLPPLPKSESEILQKLEIEKGIVVKID